MEEENASKMVILCVSTFAQDTWTQISKWTAKVLSLLPERISWGRSESLGKCIGTWQVITEGNGEPAKRAVDGSSAMALPHHHQDKKWTFILLSSALSDSTRTEGYESGPQQGQTHCCGRATKCHKRLITRGVSRDKRWCLLSSERNPGSSCDNWVMDWLPECGSDQKLKNTEKWTLPTCWVVVSSGSSKEGNSRK